MFLVAIKSAFARLFESTEAAQRREDEAFLAGATDMADLEHRERELHLMRKARRNFALY